MLKAKPDPPELPKDAYSDDFPSLSKREAANRWRGGAARGPSCAPPKVGGSLPSLSSATGPPPKGAAPCAEGPEVKAPVVANTPVPKAAGADAPNDGGSGGCAPANSEITRRSHHLSVGTAFQMSLVGIILNRETALRPCRPMCRWGWLPEASKSVGQDEQPEPADAGGAKRASPSQGGWRQ